MGNSRTVAPPGEQISAKQDTLWPWMITLGLLFVVVVNVGFIVIAVTGADEVAPSYIQGDRWGAPPTQSP